MVDLARQRLGEDADLHVAGLAEPSRAEPLPFADSEFDDVVASLVLHNLEDWSGPLAELRRVLLRAHQAPASPRYDRCLCRSSVPNRYHQRTAPCVGHSFGPAPNRL